MKQFARKSGPLSLVPSKTEPTDSSPEARASALGESLDSWLGSVAPTLLYSEYLEAEPNNAHRSRRPLSYTEITRVNRATIRESHFPRLWPPEVVLRFLAAEVIKRNR